MAFPTTPLTVLVEVALGADVTAAPATWSWTNATSKIYTRDKIHITRGRPDETTTADPCTLTMTADNRDGRWSSRNPLGAWFGQIHKGTPVRVSAEGNVRFTGFISALPPRWDVSGFDRYAPIEAKGLLYRLAQGASPLRSAMHRAGLADNPVAYWTLEDGVDATSAASAIPAGGPALVTLGSVDFAAFTDLAGAVQTPDMTVGSLAGTVVGASSSSWHAEFAIKTSFAGGGSIARIVTTGATPSHDFFSVFMPTSAGTSVQVFIGTSITLVGAAVPASFENAWHVIGVTAEQSGGNVISRLYVDGVLEDSSTDAGTLVGPNRLLLNRNLETVTSMAHALVGDGVTPSGLANAMSGYAGEQAHTRFLRLCAEEGIPATCGATISLAMGPQPVKALLPLLRECEAADQGFLYEGLDFGLTYQSHTQRENMAVALALNYTTPGHISPPLEPTDDDMDAINDVEVRTPSGASARVTEEDPNVELSIPNIGRRDESVELNLYNDDQPLQVAGWRLHISTFPGYRYPMLSLNLAAAPSLISAVCSADLAYRATITNPPTDIGPDVPDIIVEGYSEVLEQFAWDVAANCLLNGPWRVFVVSDTSADAGAFVGRLAGDAAAAIRVAIDADDTSIVIDPNRYRWTTVADDFDPDLTVRFGGETADISTIATTAATFIGATAQVHADNAAVTPTIHGSAVAGDLLLIWAAIRNSGTGIPNTPTGYTRLPVFAAGDNVQMFAKVHSGSEANPLVSFSGSSAGNTTSAQMTVWRGTPTTLDDLADIVVDSAAQLNGSAQNIAYPGLYPYLQEGCIVLAVGWKQDDHTGIATLSGFTEIDDPTSTLGNDQGGVWDYQIQTTPAAVNEGSFVVSGGAAAISRSAVFALAAGYQTMTASARSVNGTTKSHAAGTKIEVEKAYVLGL